MTDSQDPENRLIRFILISTASAVVVGFLLTALVVAVMISMNFNFLNWME